MPKVGISGWIDSWEVVNKDGSIAQSCSSLSKNTILNGGLDMVASYFTYDGVTLLDIMNYFAIGTGTALPAETDTILGSESYRGQCAYAPYTAATYSTAGSSPYYITLTRGVQTPESALDGTYTEIGFSPTATTNTPLFSKFRLVDSGGTPTSVTVSTDQQLRLKYILRIELLPNVSTSYSATITGFGTLNYHACWQTTIFGHVIRWFVPVGIPAGGLTMRSTAYTIVPIGTTVTGFGGTNGTWTSDAYVNGTHYMYQNVAFSVDQCNQENKAIGAIVSDRVVWVAAFDADSYITKPNTHRLTLKIKFSWARG